VELAWDEQDADVRARFFAEVICPTQVASKISFFGKVHKQYPVFHSKFEDGWPVAVYTRRYLDNKSRKNSRKRAYDKSQDFGLGHQPTWSNTQSYVAKPPNVDRLLVATEQDIRRAMDFDRTQFRSIQVSSFSNVWDQGQS
jgi:hypothetical protein